MCILNKNAHNCLDESTFWILTKVLNLKMVLCCERRQWNKLRGLKKGNILNWYDENWTK